MPGSTRESVTVESATGTTVPVGAPARRILRRAVRRPAGAVGILLTGSLIVAGLLAPLLAPSDPLAVVGPSLAPPGPAHPLGTDALGRDLLSAVIHGARTSLLVAAGVGAMVLVIGGTIGTVSAYYGGLVDDALMRFTELFQALPRFFLAIVAIALFGPGLELLILVLGATSWTMLARVVRAEVLSLREREFVSAARALGASDGRIMAMELLPNALPAAVALLGLVMGHVLLIEAGLGFLGLGDPNLVTWGGLVGQAQPFLRTAWWFPFFPGLAILFAVLGLNLLGEALTDALGGR